MVSNTKKPRPTLHWHLCHMGHRNMLVVCKVNMQSHQGKHQGGQVIYKHQGGQVIYKSQYIIYIYIHIHVHAHKSIYILIFYIVRVPRKMTMDTPEAVFFRETRNTSSGNATKYCSFHAKRLSTFSRTCLNVTQCHACHLTGARRSRVWSDYVSDHVRIGFAL